MAEGWSDRVGGAHAADTPGAATEDKKPWIDRPQALAMFHVRFANGNARGFHYFDMTVPDFQGNLIKLYFSHSTVLIKGRHLWELYLKLLEYKVSAIIEQHDAEGLVPGTAPYILSITIDDPNPKALTAAPRS